MGGGGGDSWQGVLANEILLFSYTMKYAEMHV